MAEVIVQIFSFSIADEEQVIAFGQRAGVGDVRDDEQALGDFAGLADEQQSLFWQVGP